jgi:putative membrane protein
MPSAGPRAKPAATLPPGHGRFLLWIGLAYLAITILSGISPSNRTDWWLEHFIIAFGLTIIISTGRWFVFSKTSYLFAFLFLILHALGAHYTYSEVPYREWWAHLSGSAPPGPEALARNHFDRAVHFLYGLLLARPFREAFYFAMAPRRDFWSHLVVLAFIMASSLFYELVEWAAAELYGGEAGMAFLGTQGDVWDAHKDMLLAAMGALFGSSGMVLRRLVTGRDPAREWGEERRRAANETVRGR